MIERYELLLAPLVGWFVAQGLKFIVHSRKDGVQLADFWVSGGFPSSHTAFVVSFTALYGLKYGFDQPLFAAMAVVSALFMYDAMGVRRSSGENALAIKELADKTGKRLVTRLHGAKGHTPLEVFAGFAVGCAVALAIYVLA